MRKKRSKYGNIRTEVDGIKFASRKEAERYKVLKVMEAEGEITNLRLQVPFRLEADSKLICRYVSDFCYRDSGGNDIVEDVKGRLTDVYKLKRKMMKLLLGVTIYET